MKIDEFIRMYKESGDKEKFCEKRIVKKYVPFVVKIAECNRIIETTMNTHDEDGNVIEFKQNTPVRFLMFHITLLQYYTDLDIDDKDAGRNFIDDYNDLNEVGAFDTLISKIPEHEYKEFSTLLSMSVDDYLTNHRTVVSYIDDLLKPYKDLILTKLQEGEQNNG